MNRRAVSIIALVAFLLNSLIGPNAAVAQPLMLPEPGTMVATSPAFVPVLIKGLKIHPENALLFDFIIDTGKSGLPLSGQEFKTESEKLIKYFLAALTIKEEDLWVNLSPYEKDRLTTDDLGRTELGRDMLAQDYILKQLTASLIYPEKSLGRQFWDKVYAEAFARYGTTDIPVDTFNKVWIAADKARVLEKNNAAYVVGAHLKVMLESDYLAARVTETENGDGDETFNVTSPSAVSVPRNTQDLAKQVVREVILPALEREVNEGQNFSPLRQMFYSMVLASWYKLALKDAFLNQVYANQKKVTGLEYEQGAGSREQGKGPLPTRGHGPEGSVSPSRLPSDAGLNAKATQVADRMPTTPEEIYAQYLEAYKKGVFNYIREENDGLTGDTVPRKYFSGGLQIIPADPAKLIERTATLGPGDDAMKVGDMAMVSASIAGARSVAGADLDRARPYLQQVVDDMAGQVPVSGTIQFLNALEQRLAEEKVDYQAVFPVTHWGYLDRPIPIISSWGDLSLEKAQRMIREGQAQAVILKLRSGQQVYLLIDNVRPFADTARPVFNTALDAAMAAVLEQAPVDTEKIADGRTLYRLDNGNVIEIVPGAEEGMAEAIVRTADDKEIERVTVAWPLAEGEDIAVAVRRAFAWNIIDDFFSHPGKEWLTRFVAARTVWQDGSGLFNGWKEDAQAFFEKVLKERTEDDLVAGVAAFVLSDQDLPQPLKDRALAKLKTMDPGLKELATAEAILRHQGQYEVLRSRVSAAVGKVRQDLQEGGADKKLQAARVAVLYGKGVLGESERKAAQAQLDAFLAARARRTSTFYMNFMMVADVLQGENFENVLHESVTWGLNQTAYFQYQAAALELIVRHPDTFGRPFDAAMAADVRLVTEQEREQRMYSRKLGNNGLIFMNRYPQGYSFEVRDEVYPFNGTIGTVLEVMLGPNEPLVRALFANKKMFNALVRTIKDQSKNGVFKGNEADILEAVRSILSNGDRAMAARFRVVDPDADLGPVRDSFAAHVGLKKGTSEIPASVIAGRLTSEDAGWETLGLQDAAGAAVLEIWKYTPGMNSECLIRLVGPDMPGKRGLEALAAGTARIFDQEIRALLEGRADRESLAQKLVDHWNNKFGFSDAAMTNDEWRETRTRALVRAAERSVDAVYAVLRGESPLVNYQVTEGHVRWEFANGGQLTLAPVQGRERTVIYFNFRGMTGFARLERRFKVEQEMKMDGSVHDQVREALVAILEQGHRWLPSGMIDDIVDSIREDEARGVDAAMAVSAPVLDPDVMEAAREAFEDREILVVDDEPVTRFVKGAILKKAGAKVVPAASAEAALEILRIPDNKIAAVVSDVNMPGMGGIALANIIKEEFPSLSVLIETADDPEKMAQYQAALPSGVFVVSKDLLPNDFLSVVARLFPSFSDNSMAAVRDRVINENELRLTGIEKERAPWHIKYIFDVTCELGILMKTEPQPTFAYLMLTDPRLILRNGDRRVFSIQYPDRPPADWRQIIRDINGKYAKQADRAMSSDDALADQGRREAKVFGSSTRPNGYSYFNPFTGHTEHHSYGVWDGPEEGRVPTFFVREKTPGDFTERSPEEIVRMFLTGEFGRAMAGEIPKGVISIVQKIQSAGQVGQLFKEVEYLKASGARMSNELLSILETMSLVFGYESGPGLRIMGSDGSIFRNWQVSPVEQELIMARMYASENYSTAFEDISDVESAVYQAFSDLPRDNIMVYSRLKQYKSLLEKMRLAIASIKGVPIGNVPVNAYDIFNAATEVKDKFRENPREYLDDLVGFDVVIDDLGMGEKKRIAAMTKVLGDVQRLLERHSGWKVEVVRKEGRARGYESGNIFVFGLMNHKIFGNLPIKIQIRFFNALKHEAAMRYVYKMTGTWEYPLWLTEEDVDAVSSLEALREVLFRKFKEFAAQQPVVQPFNLADHITWPSGTTPSEAQRNLQIIARHWMDLIADKEETDRAMTAEDVLPGRTIVVADDDPLNRGGLARLLRSYGANVIEAVDGQEALETIVRHPEIEAVLMDNNMPRKTGRELARELRKQRPGLPIVMVSGDNARVLEQIRMESGIVTLQKPVWPVEMLQVLTDQISPPRKDSAMSPGGIDLNAQKMDLDVSREGAGAAMTIDSAMAEEFRRGDFSGVVPVILKITPISGPAAVLGMTPGEETALKS